METIRVTAKLLLGMALVGKVVDLPPPEPVEVRMMDREPPFPWPESEVSAVTLLLVRQEVKDLLDALYPDPPTVPDLRGTERIYQFDEFRFARLSKGKMHLVVCIDRTGRPANDEILAIYCEGRRCETTATTSISYCNLNKQLFDSDQDGLMELVAADAGIYYPYGSGPKIPIDTFRREILVGGAFVDVSAKSLAAWEKYVEPLIKEQFRGFEEYLAEIPPPPGRDRQEAKAMAACAELFVRAETARRVYRKPEAASAETAACLNSPFKEIRDLGEQILSTVR